MKIIFLILALFVCACNTNTPPPQAKDYPNILKEVGVVNGCKVYDAHVFAPGYYDSFIGKDNYRWFMFTDCRDTTLRWTCGKNCQMENGTK